MLLLPWEALRRLSRTGPSDWLFGLFLRQCQVGQPQSQCVTEGELGLLSHPTSRALWSQACAATHTAVLPSRVDMSTLFPSLIAETKNTSPTKRRISEL